MEFMGISERRRRLLLGFGGVIVLLLLAFFVWTRFDAGLSGPRHGGKSLRQWITDMDSPDPLVRTQAIASIRRIGTNALPFLIDWMEHRDTDSERSVYDWLTSRRALVSLWPVVMRNCETHREYLALLGFYALGAEAQAALPSLERLVRSKDRTRPAKPLNAARAYVYVSPAEAARLVGVWGSSTNHELVTASERLKGMLISVKGTAGQQ
jgi:hypothetical protein